MEERQKIFRFVLESVCRFPSSAAQKDGQSFAADEKESVTGVAGVGGPWHETGEYRPLDEV